MGGGIPLPDRDLLSRPGPLIVLYHDVVHGVPPDRDPVSRPGPLIALYPDVIHGMPVGGGIPLPDRDQLSRPGLSIVIYQDVIHGVPWGETYRSLTGINCRVQVL